MDESREEWSPETTDDNGDSAPESAAEPAPDSTALSSEEIRVLGCLIEKAFTTPEYYPLTLNALRTACNQKSNRDPVVAYDERVVVKALDDLRDKKMIWMITSAGGRVPKYEHGLDERLQLQKPQMAVLCVLMLRGFQTAGELKTRTERMHPFATVAEVEQILHQLITREAGPLVRKLPRQPGKREPRYAHLLGGEPEVGEAVASAVPAEPARARLEEEQQRLEALESAVAALREELGRLQQEFAAFRRQFD